MAHVGSRVGGSSSVRTDGEHVENSQDGRRRSSGSSRMASSRRERRLATIIFCTRRTSTAGQWTSARRSSSWRTDSLESAGKPSSHSPSEWRANEPRIYSPTQPTIEINSLFDKIEFVSFSMSKTRFVVLNASWSTRLLSSVGRCFECVVVEWTRANGHSPRGGFDLTHQHSTTDGHSPLSLVHFTSLRSSAH